MKVFLSWSGKRSQQMAEFLKVWLKEVIQAAEPWISVDIDKGARWSQEISNELGQSKIGIVCLTRENLDENWILFEAGALSKTDDARPCTLLLDVKPTDIEQPLGRFQHTQFEKEDVRKLLNTINEAVKRAGEPALDGKLLDKIFERCWPELEETFKKIIVQGPETEKPTRSQEEMLVEILELARAHDRRHQEEERRTLTINAMEPSTSRRDISLMDAWEAARRSMVGPVMKEILNDLWRSTLEKEEKKNKKPSTRKKKPKSG